MEKPNILLILTDQHRLSAVGCYGQTPCKTPNIDNLASNGLRFENAYTVCPVCSPARGTIMTGQYPHRHGILANVHELGCNICELEDSPDLLSRRLQSSGYNLGYSGKWHLGTDLDRHIAFKTACTPCLPRDVGFEGQNFPGHGAGGYHYVEYRKYLDEHGYRHTVKPWSENSPDVFYAGELDGPVESTVDYFLMENTISMMEQFRGKDQPFFIWHNFWGPHAPYYALPEYLDMYRHVEIPPWPNYHWPSRAIPGPHHIKIHPDHESLKWEDWETSIRYYYASASMIDAQIGRLLDYMEKNSLLENTVIIFTSDHGETLGSHGGLIDKGWHHFEEAQRIPMIIKMPGHRAAVNRELVSLADIYPTIMDIAGCEYNRDSVHGTSLMPELENQKSTRWTLKPQTLIRLYLAPGNLKKKYTRR